MVTFIAPAQTMDFTAVATPARRAHTGGGVITMQDTTAPMRALHIAPAHMRVYVAKLVSEMVRRVMVIAGLHSHNGLPSSRAGTGTASLGQHLYNCLRAGSRY